MATQLQIDDVLSTKVWSSLSEQAAVNTYNFQVVATTGAGQTDQDWANGMDLASSIFYTTFQASSVNYDGVQVYFLRRGGAISTLSPVQSTTNAGPGTGNPAALPKNTCPILKYRGELRGPSQRGRVFLPFCSIDGTTALGVPTAALNTLITGFGTTFLTPTVLGTPPNTATLRWVIAHRQPAPNPVTTSLIIQALSADKFGQMHKRGDYGRANLSPI